MWRAASKGISVIGNRVNKKTPCHTDRGSEKPTRQEVKFLVGFGVELRTKPAIVSTGTPTSGFIVSGGLSARRCLSSVNRLRQRDMSLFTVSRNFRLGLST